MSVPSPNIVPFEQRPNGNTILLFDVDDTLTRPRQLVSVEMLDILQRLRNKYVIGFVGGSNLDKQKEQLATKGVEVTDMFDYCFAENGLVAYRLGKQFASDSFIKYVGEDRYKKLVNFILHYMADLEIPVKRGTFIEFRNGMINVSPIGRNATLQERDDFEAYDKEHQVRSKLIEILREKFADYGLVYSVGGKISFDVFPQGWDKTYCLRHLENENFKEIHFFGDKTYKGGNDHEIYEDSRTIGHAVRNPEHTADILKESFLKE